VGVDGAADDAADDGGDGVQPWPQIHLEGA
jgi:hypothetical protein